MAVQLKKQPVPARALAISIASLGIPVGAAVLFPEWSTSGFGLLTWLTALIPAFLFTYYRGFGGVAIALAGGMALIAGTQVVLVVRGVVEPNWTVMGAIVGAYLLISLGVAILVEVLQRDRHNAEAMALVDRLTGLANRRYSDMVIEQEFAAAARGRNLAVVMFDVDNLAAVNTRFGQPAGDAVIRTVARVLKDNTRKENLSARFEGGRFLSVLREADASAALVYAQRVLDQVRDLPFTWGRQTVSAGIGVFEEGMGSYELLVGVADRALYRAKEGGRDTVCVAPDKDERAAMARRAAVAEQGQASSGDAAARAQQLIYVVDDDASVRSVVKGILIGRGFAVWDTDSPEALIQRYFSASAEERPALIVADVIMPVMTGMRMIEQIAEVDPSVRVIYMSGFVHGELAWTGLPGSSMALVKPFTIAQLMGAVNKVLGNAVPDTPASGSQA